MTYQWEHFTHKSLLIIIKKWEKLILPQNERSKRWRYSWSKRELIEYMNKYNVFMPIGMEANEYNLELSIDKWSTICEESQRLTQSNDFLTETLFKHKELSLSKCEPYVVEQIFKEGLTCSICLDDLNRNTIVITRCGHHYCNECFNKIEECSLCKVNLLKDVEKCIHFKL